jgi:type IV secretory pathway TrbD component
VERAARLDRLVSGLDATAAAFERSLAEGLKDARTDGARAEAANEALGDLAAVLESRAKWSSAALRIVLLGGLLCAALCLIRQEFVSAGIVAGIIAVGAGATAWLGRKASLLDKSHRKTADRLVELLVPDAPRQTSNRGRFKDAW